jgi:hypothetical protein
MTFGGLLVIALLLMLLLRAIASPITAIESVDNRRLKWNAAHLPPPGVLQDLLRPIQVHLIQVHILS